MAHISDFYDTHSNIPLNRRPDIIHVAGQYFIAKIKPRMSVGDLGDKTKEYPSEVGKYHSIVTYPDNQAIIWTIDELQIKAVGASHINFNYSFIIDNIFNE